MEYIQNQFSNEALAKRASTTKNIVLLALLLCVIIYFELKKQPFMTTENYCKDCGETYPTARKKLGWLTCLVCGELAAKLVKHCIVPMHKSNYVPVTNLEDLKGINSKGGWYR